MDLKDSSRPLRNVLVVDDDPDIVEVMSVVLRGAGSGVLTASNGAEALERLRTALLPNLILLDLMMPVMNAWEFRKEQLADPVLTNIPVLLMTGFHQATEEAVSLGAIDILKKPIELPTLLTSIARAFVSRPHS